MSEKVVSCVMMIAKGHEEELGSFSACLLWLPKIRLQMAQRIDPDRLDFASVVCRRLHNISDLNEYGAECRPSIESSTFDSDTKIGGSGILTTG